MTDTQARGQLILEALDELIESLEECKTAYAAWAASSAGKDGEKLRELLRKAEERVEHARGALEELERQIATI